MTQEVSLQDLIDFHTRAVKDCDAYARTDNKDKQTAKRYLKRRAWHASAVACLIKAERAE